MDTGGAAARLVGFKRQFRAEIVDSDDVFLFSERGVTALSGRRIGLLAKLLDGTRDVAALMHAQPGGLAADQVLRLINDLIDAGVLDVRSAASSYADDAILAYWDECGVDYPDPATATGRVGLTVLAAMIDEQLAARALREAGVPVDLGADGSPPDLSVVLCEDYLDPRLAEVDAAHRAAGRPWLLAKPVGAQVWLGPVFRPGESACWHCLAHRLREHRHAEVCAQVTVGRTGPAPHPHPTVPPLKAAALHLVALETSKWLAGYRYPGQDSVWTLDTIDTVGRHHELRRRPQCA